MLFFDTKDNSTSDRQFHQASAEENYSRLLVASVIVLFLELLTLSYATFYIQQFLYLPMVLIPLCVVNILAWWVIKRIHGEHAKERLVYWNIAFVLMIGATWNTVMQGTHLALTIYMFMVFFVAAIFLIKPTYSLVLFVSSEILFSISILRFRGEGQGHLEDIVNSLLFVVLAWAISSMLYRAHQKLYLDKLIIEEKNALLETLYVTDRMTGLYNRHKLDEVLDREINRAERYGHELALLFIDVDKFKAFNDAYGHVAGDAVLQDISQVMKSCLRKTDTIGRWGGEEFMVICPDAKLKDALVVSERIRRRIQESQVASGRPVTLSLGVDIYVKGEDKESFVKRVDGLLYHAKNSGGNTVCEKPPIQPLTSNL